MECIPTVSWELEDLCSRIPSSTESLHDLGQDPQPLWESLLYIEKVSILLIRNDEEF